MQSKLKYIFYQILNNKKTQSEIPDIQRIIILLLDKTFYYQHFQIIICFGNRFLFCRYFLLI